MEAVTDVWVDECPRDMRALEIALLRHGVEHRDATRQRCSSCRRTPLVGERVYVTDDGPVLCALCHSGQAELRLHSQVVRTPGRAGAIRVLDQRTA